MWFVWYRVEGVWGVCYVIVVVEGGFWGCGILEWVKEGEGLVSSWGEVCGEDL